MKKLFILSFLILAISLSSCKEESLQSYMVESQEKEGFINLDLPASLLEIAVDKASEEDLKAYQSIKKINLIALPYKNSDEATYEAEKAKLKAIFKNSSYKSLMNFKDKGNYANIYYLGEADAIDEIVAFGYGKEAGVGVARLLGENMNPGAIIKMMKTVKFDGDDMDFNQFKTMLNSASK